MNELSLKILNQDLAVMAEARDEDEVNLEYGQEYLPGDKIIVETAKKNIYVWMQLDDAKGSSLVYLTGDVTYEIPFDEKRINQSPKAFSGTKHLLRVKVAKDFEVEAYRNLALNVYDQHGMTTCFPHAQANVETRGESVFAAQNAIDGVTINSSHGGWPHQSWGINRQDDATIRIVFGRTVEIDQIVLYTRADFPHDNWWTQASFTCSDGSELTIKMEKSVKPHRLMFEKKQVEWVEMHDMIKADDPSPFPALTQIEIYGKEVLG